MSNLTIDQILIVPPEIITVLMEIQIHIQVNLAIKGTKVVERIISCKVLR